MEKHLISFIWEFSRVFFDCICCLLGYQIFGGFNFSKRISKWLLIIVGITAVYLGLITRFPVNYKEPISVLLFSSLTLLIDPPNNKQALAIYPFIYFSSSSIAATLLMISSAFTNHKQGELLYNSILTHFLINIFTILILLLLYYIFRKRKKNTPINITKVQYVIFYITIITIFMIISAWQYIATYLATSREFAIIGSCTSIACLLLLFLVIYQAFLNTNQQLLEEKQLLQEKFYQIQENYFKEKSVQDQQLRQFKHDYYAHFMILNTLVKEQNYAELEKYLSKMKENSKLEKTAKYTGNLVVDSFLENIIIQAKKAEITINIKGHLPLELDIETYDLSIVCYNLFQNAIEATKNVTMHHKYIDITVSEYERGHAYIHISNPVDYPVKIVSNTVITSKKDSVNHGLGLANVKLVSEKYDNQFKLICTKNTFIAEIFI